MDRLNKYKISCLNIATKKIFIRFMDYKNSIFVIFLINFSIFFLKGSDFFDKKSFSIQNFSFEKSKNSVFYKNLNFSQKWSEKR